MKRAVTGIGILLIIAGCGGVNEDKPSENNQPAEEEASLQDEDINNEETGEQDEEDVRAAVEEIEHIHDMAFDREEEGILYVGTHHGLLQADLTSNDLVWQGTEEDRHDFMGFLITAENLFMSSGHPGHGSDLQNPLGVMTSDDRGENWETGALYGDVDFHLMDANEGDSSFLYGFDAYGGRMFKSEDGGQEWEQVEADGINDRFQELYSITSDPEDPETVLAGMSDGIYRSEDGGESFTLFNGQVTMTSVSQGPDGVIYAHGIGAIEGLMTSSDMGETWEPLGQLPEEAEPVISLAVDHHNPNTLAIGTIADSLYWSEDQGETWELLIEDGEPV